MSGRFRVTPTALDGLSVVERTKLQDDRGFFSRFFCNGELAEVGFAAPIVQVNHTLTRRIGAVRGLHFQYPPHTEDKFVSCLKGRIFDVVVDVRRGSPTFLKWHIEELAGENGRSMLIPKGFAHGFQTLEPDCELLYLHSQPFAANGEGALNARDERLAIPWPLPISELSDRDRSHPMLTAEFTGIETTR